MGERKTFSVRILPNVMKALRILAVQKDTSLSDLLEEAIQDYMKKSGFNAKKKAGKK